MHPGVLSFALERWVDPAAAFAALFDGRTDVFWLDSGPRASAGRSFMGAARRVVSGGAEVLEEVAGDLAARRIPPADGLPLGWVGWLGYELRGATMGVAGVPRSRYSDAAFLDVDRALVFDHAAEVVTLVALGESWTPELEAWRSATVATLETAGAPVAPAVPHPATATWAYDEARYLEMIAACQRSIEAGDAYQLCLTTEATVDVAPDPLATYLALRDSSPSHHGALVRIGDVALLSASPEQFLTVTPEGIVESRPIKGTRPRGATPQLDEALRAELLASEKERAENLMIVDLMRNDITRIAEVGSIAVTSLLAVESYAHVHQLVSTVQGRLAPGLSAMDAVRACFPAGSMTGAPKRSATLILDGLEQRARGIYSGAFGLFSLDGTVDLAMVIRSIVLDPRGATIGAGGGITALSVPAEELAEVRLKAAALLRVLGA